MTGEELYEIRRRVAFDEGLSLPQWIVLREDDRRLWDKTGMAIMGQGLLRPRVLRGFVPAAHQRAYPLPPRHKTKT